MKPRANEMRRLLEQVAVDLGDGATRDRLADQTERFVSLVTDEVPVRRQRIVPAFVAAAAVLALVLSAVLFWPTDDTLRFWIGDERVAGTVGVWLEAPVRASTTVGFEQGSRVVLEARAAARVVAADEDAVRIDLSRGTIDADVVGNQRTRWSVEAGPFRVTVLGTRFRVDWRTETKVLNVKVSRGVVLVQGKGLGEHGIKVSSGKHLRAESRTGFVSLNAVDSKSYDPGQSSLLARGQVKDDSPVRTAPAQQPTESNPAAGSHPAVGETVSRVDGTVGTLSPQPVDPLSRSEETPVVPPAGREVEAERAEAPAGPSQIFERIDPIAPVVETAEATSETEIAERPATDGEAPAADPNQAWLALYDDEEFSRAVRAAEDIGLDSLLKRSRAENLWKLGDAARAAGRGDVAWRVLITYRERFPATKRATTASFLLGRIASDGKGDFKAAAHWFDTCLREDAGGPLAEEAMGRLIIVYRKMGNIAEAKQHAKRYLRKYEDGSFDAVARSVLDDE